MKNLRLKSAISLLSVALGALIGWTFYELANQAAPRELLSVTVAVMASLFLIGTIGLRHTSRAIVSIKAASAIFIVVTIIIDAIFACFDFSIPLFIIVNAILAIAWFIIVKSISDAGDTQPSGQPQVNKFTNNN